MRVATPTLLASLIVTPVGAPPAPAAQPMDFAHVAALRSVDAVKLSPDGRTVAFTLSVPRQPGVDDDGAAWSELHVVPAAGGPSRAYVRGEVNVSAIEFTPDGRFITYLAKRDDDEEAALWAIPVAGGESVRLVEFESGIESYEVSPDGARVAFVAQEPEAAAREKAKEKGYKQEVFEEDWRARHAWIAPLPPLEPVVPDPTATDDDDAVEPRKIAVDGSAWNVTWSLDGEHVALDLAPRPLIDDQYMKRRVTVVRASLVAAGEVPGDTVRAVLDNPGKLGAFSFSPDGGHVAMISAADPNDPNEGRLMVAPAAGGALRDLLPGLAGHVLEFAWRDDRTLRYLAAVGVENAYGEVTLDGKAKTLHTSGPAGNDHAPLLTKLSLSADGKTAAFVGERPTHPSEVFVLTAGDRAPRRLTTSNPWLDDLALAPQEVVRHPARDGLELEGLLIRPLDGSSNAPVVLIVHGGPEAHQSNGWLTSYSRPGQLLAARGMAVFYPNYRGSTGRGVAFSKLGQGDAAGKEFDDLVDAVDWLVAQGIADRDRVGVTGGSYGGYATAWLATRYTERFKAGVMFVGISDTVGKALTTEIPLEDKMVHTLHDPWKVWQDGLERSPIYHAEKSRTALLIAGGTDDNRVHPAQSLQLYRALKLLGQAPVRYVRYPGEGHGNRKAAARDDYCRRTVRWFEHYLQGPGGDPPPWDLGLGAPESAAQEGADEG